MNYAEAEEYINQIPRFSKVKSEENVDEILALFGHPEKKFAYIHVAGTNGKGSVCAFLDSMLRMAGKKTGLFTSPHLSAHESCNSYYHTYPAIKNQCFCPDLREF